MTDELKSCKVCGSEHIQIVKYPTEDGGTVYKSRHYCDNNVLMEIVANNLEGIVAQWNGDNNTTPAPQDDDRLTSSINVKERVMRYARALGAAPQDVPETKVGSIRGLPFSLPPTAKGVTIEYTPKAASDARIAELEARCASLIGYQAGLLLEELEKVRNEALEEAVSVLLDWRECDWPEDFDRGTAQCMADDRSSRIRALKTPEEKSDG